MLLSMPEYERFKNDLEQINQDIVTGKTKTVSFVDGPKHGHTAMVMFENHLPTSIKGYFIVPNSFSCYDKVDQAEYSWDIQNEQFTFTGNIIKSTVLVFLQPK